MFITCTATGSTSGNPNTIALTPTDTTQPAAYADQGIFLFKSPITNNLPVTIAYDGLTAQNAVSETSSGQVAVTSGFFISNNWYLGLRDATAGTIIVVPFTAANAVMTNQVSSNSVFYPLLAAANASKDQAVDLAANLSFVPANGQLTAGSFNCNGTSVQPANGMWSIGANTLGISVNASTAAQITSSGNLTIPGNFSAANFPGANSLGVNGYRTNPDGSIEQWGTSSTINQGTSGSVSYPIAFPNHIWNLQVTTIDGSAIGLAEASVTGVGLSSFTIENNQGTYGPNLTFYWRALGN